MAAWVKVLLFVLGGVGAAGGTAYLTGLLDPWLAPPPPAVVAPAPETSAPETSAPETSAPETPAPAAEQPAGEPAPEAAGQEEAGDPVTTAKQDRLAPPVFDVLRVEPDGSVLVAGKAGAKATVEVLSGETVLGAVTAGEEGDFVVVLEQALKPGDYRLALRATVPGAGSVLSAGTAIVSIPEAKDGQVLAMVEEPGAPAQLVTVPQVKEEVAAVAPDEHAGTPKPAAAPAATPADEPAGEPANTAAPQPGAEAAAPAVVEEDVEEPAAPAGQQPAATHTIAVEAVEIEGGTVFVAGRAGPGGTVRVYADALLLGDATVSDGGRFLVESRRDLAVGNYLIRADLIGKDGAVLARAAVPFEREPGEAIAAVAPAAPAPAQETEPAEAAVEAAGEDPAEETPAKEAPAEAGTEVAAAPAAPAQPAAPARPAAPAQPATGAEVATAPPLQRVDGAVIIRRGDSLWRISRRVYGHGIRYSTIYLANQNQIRDPDRIWPGQVFTVPHETPEGEQADLEAVGEQAVKPRE